MRMRITSLVALVLLAGGCSIYRVRVNAYLDTKEKSRIPQGVSVRVVESENAANPLLEHEVALKIERLLVARGCKLAPEGEADFIVLFGYGIAGRDVIDTRPVNQPGGTASLENYSAQSYAGMTSARASSIVYVPYVKTVYARWLTLEVVEAAPYRRSGTKNDVWVCEARSTGNSDDLRGVINYLLVAALRHFGEDTGRQVVTDIRADDPHVEALMQ